METKNKTTEIREKLFLKFRIDVSRRWIDRYLYLYCHCIPNENTPIKEAINNINSNDIELLTFAYFIHGHRSEHYNKLFNHKSE